MSVTSCLEPQLVQQGRGKVFTHIVENHSHIDHQHNPVRNKGYVYFPSITYKLQPPNSPIFRSYHRVDNVMKTSGDNTCLFTKLK